MPALPHRNSHRPAQPCLPCPTTLCLAEPCLPNHAHRAIPVQSMPRLPILSLPDPVSPCESMPAFLSRTVPFRNSPRLACHTCPHRAPPFPAMPAHACLAVPYRNGPCLATPRLLRFKRHSMPNLALIALSRSLSTTWNKPNPHPALALLSGLPAPIPTCKPQRLIKLITSTVLN